MPVFTSTAALRIVDAMAIVISQALQLARARLASAASPVLRMMVQRDHAVGELELLGRELQILRDQRSAMPPHRRPDYSPELRLAILQLMRLRDWSVPIVAARFVLHPNTVRSWIAAIEGRGNQRLLVPGIVWNRVDDLVRWAVHELRCLCPEREIGTRTLARHLVRAGIAISRTTVQRILREPKPARPRPRHPAPVAVGIKPYHLLNPKQPNAVWHVDMTVLRVLWFRFIVTAILDGATRQLLVLRVYRRTPCTSRLVALVRHTVSKHGRPRFVITDNGCHFRKQFKAAMHRLGIHHVRGRVRQPFLNGKVERLFRSFRAWWRWVLPTLTVSGLQTKLDTFREWYNTHRVHAALSGRTPNEAAQGRSLVVPMPLRQRDPCAIDVQVSRQAYRGDPRLPILSIAVQRRHAA